MPSSTGTQGFRGHRYFTKDGNLAVAGSIQNVNNGTITLFDRRNRQSINIPQSNAVPMTRSQMEAYLSGPSADDPHPQETLKRRLEVRASWDTETARARRG